MSDKVNLEELKLACKQMVALIEEIQNPETDSSGARRFGFPLLKAKILFELIGNEENNSMVGRFENGRIVGSGKF